jgi:hypothetical protein
MLFLVTFFESLLAFSGYLRSETVVRWCLELFTMIGLNVKRKPVRKCINYELYSNYLVIEQKHNLLIPLIPFAFNINETSNPLHQNEVFLHDYFRYSGFDR